MSQRKIINWEEPEKAFIYGLRDEDGKKYYPTLKQISDKYEINYNSVRSRSMKNQWQERRNNLHEKISSKLQEKESEFDAVEIVTANENFKRTAEKARSLVDLKLEDMIGRVEDGKFVRGVELMNTVSALKYSQEVFLIAMEEKLGEYQINADMSGLNAFAETIEESLRLATGKKK